MAYRVIKEEMIFPFEFTSPVELIIEESLATKAGVAMISGVLLREGVSKNKNLYTISEMPEIAKRTIGKPIYYGTMIKRDNLTGILKKDAHADITKNRIGKIIDTVFDKANRLIRFIAEIVNTPTFPHIVEEVKAGWGISIGGIANKAKLIVDEARRILIKVLDLDVQHVQLLPPNKTAGIVGAEVKNVEIQESMIIWCDEATGICYDSCGMPTSMIEESKEQITKVHIGPFIKRVKIED